MASGTLLNFFFLLSQGKDMDTVNMHVIATIS